jgi:hypothetical protein
MYCIVAAGPEIFWIPAMTKMKASMMRPSSAPVLRSESIGCFASRIAAGQESSAHGPISASIGTRKLP